MGAEGSIYLPTQAGDLLTLRLADGATQQRLRVGPALTDDGDGGAGNAGGGLVVVAAGELLFAFA